MRGVSPLCRTLILGGLLSLGLLAAPLPKSLQSCRFAGPGPGTTVSFSDAPGQVLVILLAGRNSYEAAYQQAASLAQEFPRQPVCTVVVSDLGGVPGFVKSAAEEAIVRQHKDVIARLGSQCKLSSALDWNGQFAREMDVVGETGDVYLAYVVSAKGQIQLRLKQKVNNLTEERLHASVVAAVRGCLQP